MAHAQGALVLVDNSIMSPVLSQPLELGAGIIKDSIFHPVSKLFSGVIFFSSTVLILCCWWCRYCDAFSYKVYRWS